MGDAEEVYRPGRPGGIACVVLGVLALGHSPITIASSPYWDGFTQRWLNYIPIIIVGLVLLVAGIGILRGVHSDRTVSTSAP